MEAEDLPSWAVFDNEKAPDRMWRTRTLQSCSSPRFEFRDGLLRSKREGPCGMAKFNYGNAVAWVSKHAVHIAGRLATFVTRSLHN